MLLAAIVALSLTGTNLAKDPPEASESVRSADRQGQLDHGNVSALRIGIGFVF